MAKFGKHGFSSSLSDYYGRWGADIEQRERRARGQELQRIERSLQTSFDLAEARRQAVGERFRQLLDLFPADRLPPELEGFSAEDGSPLSKTILYFASLGLRGGKDLSLPAGEMVPGFRVSRAEPLFRALRTAHPRLLSGRSLSDAPFFAETGALDETRCGSFWQACIRAEAARRSWEEQEYGEYEEGVMSYDLELGLEELLTIRDLFRGDDPDRDRSAEAGELLRCFEKHTARLLGQS